MIITLLIVRFDFYYLDSTVWGMLIPYCLVFIDSFCYNSRFYSMTQRHCQLTVFKGWVAVFDTLVIVHN